MLPAEFASSLRGQYEGVSPFLHGPSCGIIYAHAAKP